MRVLETYTTKPAILLSASLHYPHNRSACHTRTIRHSSTMRQSAAVLVVLIFAVLYTFSPSTVCALPTSTNAPAKKYTGVNIENVLGNDRLLSGYIRCLLDEGLCTRDGNNLKQLLPDAIQTDCSKCTPAQKQNSRKVITFFRTHRPQDWKRLTNKYDPLGQFKGSRQ